MTTKLARALASAAGRVVDELEVSPMDGNEEAEKKKRQGRRLLHRRRLHGVASLMAGGATCWKEKTEVEEDGRGPTGHADRGRVSTVY